MKQITWQEIAEELFLFIKEKKLLFVESLVSAHLSYNFLVRNKRGKRICSERDLASLADLLLCDYKEAVRRSGKWEREFGREAEQFFSYFSSRINSWGSPALASDLSEQFKKLF